MPGKVVKRYLFTTPNCPNCPSAKEFAEGLEEEYELVEVGTHKNGNKLAGKYKVMGVPMFVEEYDNGTVRSKTLTELKNLGK